MNKKSVRDVEVSGKRVFVRVDFNVPLENGHITDDTRIRETLPTIKYLTERGAKVILASHLGRPKGQVVEELRLTPAAARLSELLGKPVLKADEAIGDAVKAQVAALNDGDVLLLENVRFYAGEEKNDPELAKSFAELADLYVNDAFGAAHRAHASTEGIAHHLPAVSGLLMEKELDVLGKALNNPERPFTAIVGGAKVKDKIDVINNLLNIADNIIIGGGLSYTFLKALGNEIGKSLVDNEKIDLALSFINKAKEKRRELPAAGRHRGHRRIQPYSEHANRIDQRNSGGLGRHRHRAENAREICQGDCRVQAGRVERTDGRIRNRTVLARNACRGGSLRDDERLHRYRRRRFGGGGREVPIG